MAGVESMVMNIHENGSRNKQHCEIETDSARYALVYTEGSESQNESRT